MTELWLCEEYLDGYEISVECVVDKEHKEVVAIHDKMTPMDCPPFLEKFLLHLRLGYLFPWKMK